MENESIKEVIVNSTKDMATWMLKICCLLILAFSISTQKSLFAQNKLDPIQNKYNIIHADILDQINNETELNSLRTGEFLLDTNIVYVPEPHNQETPSIAAGGSIYFIVWQDSRDGSCPYIYGARVTLDGTVLDPTGIPISTGTGGHGYSPAVAFDGTNFLIVWSQGDGDILAARVTPTGVVLDPTGIGISTAMNEQYLPSVAFDGTNYLVVWQDRRSDSFDIYGARVTPTGVVLDPVGIAISTAFYDQWSPSVAFDGTNYLVVWDNYGDSPLGDIYGARVNQSGTVLDTMGIPISYGAGDQDFPSATFDGSNYLVVWQDSRAGSSKDIYGTRVTPAGTVLDPTGIPISTEASGQYSPSVAFDGTNYLVVWFDFRNPCDIYGARVTTTGVVLDPSGILLSNAVNSQLYPSVAFDGTNYLVAWQDYRSDSTFDAYGTRVTPDGTVLDPAGIPISTIANYQWFPSVAFDGINYLVVWQDLRGGFYDGIYGTRVTSTGIVLDPTSITISTATSTQYSPSVAFDGTNYFVVWQDGRNDSSYYDIYGARVTPTGVVLDSTGIHISTEASVRGLPSVAFDGVNYLVVWLDGRNVYSCDIYGARVTPAGAVLDTAGFIISTAAYEPGSPSVAFDGTNYLVAWYDFRSSSYDIYGARVTTTGVVLDPAGIAISTALDEQCSPSVAFDGTNYLVVWHDFRRGSWDIYGARVSLAGAVLDSAGIPISTEASEECSPSVAFDGANYLVIWEDWRSGPGNIYSDIYGARVNQSGVVVDTFVVTAQPGDQLSPCIAAGSAGQLLTAYSCFTDSINNHPANTMRIWGKFYPFTTIAENNGFMTQAVIYGLESYPNPFFNHTTIKLHPHTYPPPSMERKKKGECNAQTTLKIYDAYGRLVKFFNNLTDQQLQVIWYGDDDSGHTLPAGIYFCRFEANSYRISEKIIKIR